MITSTREHNSKTIIDIEEQNITSVRLTIPVRVDQEELLTKMVRMISSNRDRDHKKARITKATIIRAYIDALSSITVDIDNISNEKVLLQRILTSLKNRS